MPTNIDPQSLTPTPNKSSQIISPSEKKGYKEIKGTGTIIGSRGSGGSVSYSYIDTTVKPVSSTAQNPATQELIEKNLAQRESATASSAKLFQQNLANRNANVNTVYSYEGLKFTVPAGVNPNIAFDINPSAFGVKSSKPNIETPQQTSAPQTMQGINIPVPIFIGGYKTININTATDLGFRGGNTGIIGKGKEYIIKNYQESPTGKLVDYILLKPFQVAKSFGEETVSYLKKGESKLGFKGGNTGIIGQGKSFLLPSEFKDVQTSDVLNLGVQLIPTTYTGIAGYMALEKAYQISAFATSTGFAGYNIRERTSATTNEEKLMADLGIFLGVSGIYYSKFGQGFKDEVLNIRYKKYSEADLLTKPFFKDSEGKYVFNRRYEGYTDMRITGRQFARFLKGEELYKGGQFIERQYKLTPNEVKAKIENIKNPQGWEINHKTGEITFVDITPKNFPTANPQAHLKWFKEYGKTEYYLPKQADLPMEVRQYAYGHTATPKKFDISSLSEQVYFSGKGVSEYFLRLGAYEKTSIGFDFSGSKKPYVETVYFKNVEVNKALREVKIENPRGGKEMKQYKFKVYGIKTPEGKLIIPKNKMEVEGVYRGMTKQLRDEIKFRVQGRIVGFRESVAIEPLKQEFKRISNQDLIQEKIKAGKTSSSYKEFTGEYKVPPQLISYKPSSSSRSSSSFKSNLSALKSYGTSSRGSGSSSSKINKLFSRISKGSSSLSSGFEGRGGSSYTPPDKPRKQPPRKTINSYSDFQNYGKKMDTKRKGGKEDIAINPSFTSQILGIKQYVNKAQLKALASRTGSGTESRGVIVLK